MYSLGESISHNILLSPSNSVAGCDYLEGPENGNVVLTGTTVGSTATYSCYPGFILLGKFNVRTCLNSGEWSGQAPTCRRRSELTGFHEVDSLMNLSIVRVLSHVRIP